MGDLLDFESVGSDGSEDEVKAIHPQGLDEPAQHQHIQPQTQDGRDREVLGTWMVKKPRVASQDVIRSILF